MKLLLSLLVAAAFAGCETADHAFRSRVDSVEGSASGNYDDHTGQTAVTIGGRVYFRNPDAKSIKPLQQ